MSLSLLSAAFAWAILPFKRPPIEVLAKRFIQENSYEILQRQLSIHPTPEKSQSSNDRTNISPALSTARVIPLSPRYPRVGEIWKGRDLDGISEYEILIQEVGASYVKYAFAYKESRFISTHEASLSIFLALYSPRRTPPPCKASSSKISWLDLPRFYSGLGKLWEKLRHALQRKFF